MTKIARFPQRFYAAHTLDVAKKLLGKTLHFEDQQVIITETEAYRGNDDEASHAFKGRTPRTEGMYGPPGMLYVYLTYGMYYCLNIVTEPEGIPAAVLIRGVALIIPPYTHFDGPGKTCRQLKITKQQDKTPAFGKSSFYISGDNETLAYIDGPRIGIKVGLDKQWRFRLKTINNQ